MLGRKGIILATSVFSCIALLATGFAAFIITSTTADEGVGQIQVDTVERNDIKVVIDDNATDLQVHFGARQLTEEEAAAAQYGWLGYSDKGTPGEDLVCVIKGEIENYAAGVSLTVTIEEVVAEGATGYYAAAVGAGYVNSLESIQAATNQSKIVVESDGTFTITLDFSWGSKFNSVNPIVYYNNQEPTTEMMDDAEDTINGEVFQNLKDAKFKVTITPKVA